MTVLRFRISFFIMWAIVWFLSTLGVTQNLRKIDLDYDFCNLRGGAALSSGRVIVGGYCYHSDSLKNQMVLAKIKTDGTLINQLILGGVSNEQLQKLALSPTGNCVIAVGEVAEGTRRKGLIVACDTNLTLLWQREVASPFYDITLKGVQLLNDTVVCVGTRTELINQFANSAYYLFACNLDGDSLGQSAGQAFNFEIANVVTMSPHAVLPLVVAGDAVGVAMVNPFHTYVNRNLKFTDAYLWPQEGFGAGFQAAASIHNHIYFGGEGYPPGSSTFDFLIGKVDSANQILWQKWLHTPGTNAIFSMLAINDSLLAFTGYSNGADTTAAIDAVLGIIDSSGHLLHLQHIANPGIDIGYVLVQHHDQLILAGTFADGIKNRFGIYQTQLTEILSLKKKAGHIEAFSVHPNPVRHISSPIKIYNPGLRHIQQIQLIDAQGRCLHHWLQPFEPSEYLQLKLPKLFASGIYLLLIQADDRLYSKKLIFEH